MRISLPTRRPWRCTVSIVATIAALILSACATEMNAPWADLGAQPSAPTGPRLAAGDKLTVTIFDEPNLSGDVRISPAGTVSMPLIGHVRAAGRTPDDFRRELVRRYANGYLKNPRVVVEVANYRPVFIHGEVRNGGEYPYKSGLTLRDAIAVAGGYSYRADESFILLMRAGSKGPVKVPMPSAHLVQPGDNIRVPERFF